MSLFTKAHNWYQPYGKKYITIKELHWEIGKVGSNLWLVVPKGFIFDVSSPWYLHWYVDPHDPQYFKPSALHDYALSLGWDRVSSAAALSEAAKAKKIPKWKRFFMVVGTIWYNWR